MRLNYLTKPLSFVGRCLATSIFCLSAIAFFWQGAFFLNTSAMAAPGATLIATSDAANQAKGAADELRYRSKDLIRGTEAKVKDAARSNAAKVVDADETGSAVEGKALRDKSRIEKRASEDANRTEKAVDKSMNAVKGVVDNIKDALN